jgi:GNAT superfamily N-acetyltransferase
MLTVEMVNTQDKSQVNRFVDLHYRLYKNTPQWVPPFYSDIKMMLNREKHPFYEHSTGDFFVAKMGNEVVARVGVFENRPFNQYHQVKKAQFYLFDSIDDQEAVNALFERVFDWCKKRGLVELVGPKGLSPFDGYGIQVEGTEHRQMMTMMNYNFPYYQKLMENMGFEKEVDFVSCYLGKDKFALPEKAREVARRVQERGSFKVKTFTSKKELKEWAWRIGEAYNKTFINNWEYYPLTEREIKYLLDNILIIAVPRLIKVITYKDDVVGFIFGFPDVSAALQRHGGHITPWGIVDIMLELKRTKWISLNGVGVLPQYHGRGGNALMYYEMEKTLLEYGYDHTELTQVAETAVQMRKDLITSGGDPYKNHRIFHTII